MSKKTIIILAVLATIVVLFAVGYGIHHMMTGQMQM